jgi:hypothetical protein
LYTVRLRAKDYGHVDFARGWWSILERKARQLAPEAMTKNNQTTFFMERISQVMIPCKASPGMFDNEYAVEITLPGEEKISLFADKSLVVSMNGADFLKVNLVQDDQNKEEQPVLLPSESFEKGSRWVSIPKKQLIAA